MAAAQFEISDPPKDCISAVKFAPSGLQLLVSSWDRHVYLYQVEGTTGRLIERFEHRAPVLDVCWGETEDVAYSCGLDWDVRRIDLRSSQQTVLSSHTAGVRSIVYAPQFNVLISASWDSTLHVHHTPSPTDIPSKHSHSPTSVRLPHKPFALALSASKLVVAMASRALYIYDVPALAMLSSQAPAPTAAEAAIDARAGEIGMKDTAPTLDIEPWQRRESSLKFMTRAVACMPDDKGYAASSIEGRVAVEWFDPDPASQARKYAFKCHRQASTPADAAAGTPPIDIVYPVNALAFHPVYGTFASGGGDGFVALWDGLQKRRIRQFQRFPASVAALSFSHEGKYLAVAVSPGFEDGKEGASDSLALTQGQVAIFIREFADGEAKGKSK